MDRDYDRHGMSVAQVRLNESLLVRLAPMRVPCGQCGGWIIFVATDTWRH